MYQESFPSKLKKARERTGFTQREVSAETKIAQSTLAKYETGKTQPDIENLGILADFYEVSIDWLIGTNIANMTKMETQSIDKKNYNDRNMAL